MLSRLNLIPPVPSHFKKYSRSPLTQIKIITLAVPSLRGAYRDQDNGRPPYKVRWKGCVWLKKDEKVDAVDVDKTDGANEIIYNGRHWFSDGGPF